MSFLASGPSSLCSAVAVLGGSFGSPSGAPDPAPVNLSEAALDAASGLFGDLDADDIFLEYATLVQPPYLLAGAGLAIAVLCGLTFARLVQNRLDGWKQDRLKAK